MNKPRSKPPVKPGFRRLSFDEAYPVAIEHQATMDELRKPLSRERRSALRNKLRTLDNKITPAARLSSAPFERMVLDEMKSWIDQHGVPINISAFIRHFQSLACARRLRRKSGDFVHASDDAIRKILRKRGVHGIRGRPQGAP